MTTRAETETLLHPSPLESVKRAGAAILRRWPAALGLAFAAFNLITDDPNSVSSTLLVLVVATTGYIVIAALERPRWSWPVIGILVSSIVTARLLSMGSVVELIALSAIVVGAIVIGTVRGTFSRPGLPRWQPFAAIGFMVLAIGALWLSPAGGQILIAGALIGHAVWDVVHWRRDAVVSRSLAEWCAFLDFTLGVGVLVMIAV
jgi:hypothetical protein